MCFYLPFCLLFELQTSMTYQNALEFRQEFISAINSTVCAVPSHKKEQQIKSFLGLLQTSPTEQFCTCANRKSCYTLHCITPHVTWPLLQHVIGHDITSCQQGPCSELCNFALVQTGSHATHCIASLLMSHDHFSSMWLVMTSLPVTPYKFGWSGTSAPYAA